jgi:hypothetical protein
LLQALGKYDMGCLSHIRIFSIPDPWVKSHRTRLQDPRNYPTS